MRENVGYTAAENLIDATEKQVKRIQQFPEIGRPSRKNSKVRFVLVKKNYRLYYRLGKNRTLIVYFFDTRQHPDKNIY